MARRIAGAALALVLSFIMGASAALAQVISQPGGSGGGAASAAGWTQVGLANITVGSSSAATALPTASTNLWVINTGSTTVYYTLGTSSGVTTTTSAASIAAGSCQLLVQTPNTYIATIAASSGSLQVQTGTGTPLGCGGGGSSSNASVGTNGSTAPSSSTAIGGFDSGSLLRQFQAESGTPGASDWGLNVWSYQLGTGGPLYQAATSPLPGQAATGVDIGAVENNVNMGGAQVQLHVCGSQATVNPSTATDTQIIAPVSGKNIYVCDLDFSSNGANTFYLESATAASCGGTLSAIGTTWYVQQYSGAKGSNPFYRGKNTGAGNGLCLHTTAAQGVSLTVYYDQY